MKKRAFTLPEVLVGIAVIGIMLGFLNNWLSSTTSNSITFKNKSDKLTEVSILLDRLRTDISSIKNVFIGKYKKHYPQYRSLQVEKKGSTKIFRYYIYYPDENSKNMELSVRCVEIISDFDKLWTKRIVYKAEPVEKKSVGDVKLFAMRYMDFNKGKRLLEEKFKDVVVDMYPSLDPRTNATPSFEVKLSFMYYDMNKKKRKLAKTALSSKTKGDKLWSVTVNFKCEEGMSIYRQPKWNKNENLDMVYKSGVNRYIKFDTKEDIEKWLKELKDPLFRNALLQSQKNMIKQEYEDYAVGIVYKNVNEWAESNYGKDKMKDMLLEALKKKVYELDNKYEKFAAFLFSYQIKDRNLQVNDDFWKKAKDGDLSESELRDLWDKMGEYTAGRKWIFFKKDLREAMYDSKDFAANKDAFESDLKKMLTSKKDEILRPSFDTLWQEMLMTEVDKAIDKSSFYNTISSEDRANLNNKLKQLETSAEISLKTQLGIDAMLKAAKKLAPQLEGQINSVWNDYKNGLVKIGKEVDNEVFSTLKPEGATEIKKKIQEAYSSSSSWQSSLANKLSRFKNAGLKWLSKLTGNDYTERVAKMPIGLRGALFYALDQGMQGRRYNVETRKFEQKVNPNYVKELYKAFGIKPREEREYEGSAKSQEVND